MADGGYTKVPHWLLAKLYRSDLTSRELKVILYIIRDTLGYHKNSEKIAYGRIAEATGIDRRNVIKVVQSLEEKGFISVSRKKKCINIIRLKGGVSGDTRGGVKKCKKVVSGVTPTKDSQKSNTSGLHSFEECNPRGKISIDDLQNELGDEYE